MTKYMTMYEVELKFPLPDASAVLSRLRELGAKPLPALAQCDLYFRHPVRDFSQTHEAFRMRISGEENRITYKGPVIDSQTKTRHEIEIPFAPGADAARQLEVLLTLLGFTPIRRVHKQRQPYELAWEGETLEVVHDTVEGLGAFLEIEAIADEQSRIAARDRILSLAARLNLPRPEPRSYLRMLLERDLPPQDA